MLVHSNDSRALFPYKQASFERIRDAFDRLVEISAAPGAAGESASQPSTPPVHRGG